MKCIMSFGTRDFSATQLSVVNNIQFMSDREQRALQLGCYAFLRERYLED